MKKKKKLLLIGGGLIAVGATTCYIKKLKDEIRGLKNENLNLQDLNTGQENVIRSLSYGLGKAINKNH